MLDTRAAGLPHPLSPCPPPPRTVVETGLEPALVAHLGRKGLRIALTDARGLPQLTGIRTYSADASSSVAGALTAFQRELGLDRLPERIAIAVAGLPRGDTISVTQTRWFVSRSGLRAMLGQPPLILNDFEAEAWALAEHQDRRFEPIGASPPIDPQRPGTYCIVGMTSGLGVSLMTRHADGGIAVVATEAGHAALAPASRALADLTAALFPDRYPVVAEHLISAVGLGTIYDHLATVQKSPRRSTTPEAITRNRATDPVARQACDLLAEAFSAHLGSLVLTFGAWDGLIVTGGLASALRPILASDRMRAVFAGTGKYGRLLQAMPRAFCDLDHAELIGAAQALRSR